MIQIGEGKFNIAFSRCKLFRRCLKLAYDATCLRYKFFVIFPSKVAIDLSLQLFVHRQFGQQIDHAVNPD